LQARPKAPGEAFVADPRTPSFRPLGLDRRKDAVLYTPMGVDWSKPVPLVLALHGSGGVAYDCFAWFKAYANEHKFLVLAPPSRKETWDVDLGPIGPDAAFIDRALDWVFQRFPIDPAHIAIAGYSDGASYALCMGLQNGDVFSDVMAFEAIRFAAPDAVGRPRFFFSHGRLDEGTSLSNCLQMVKQLKDLGYDVALDIHPKNHIVADQGVRAGVARFLS
jgi:phospholipase/carboxylesterase